MKSLTPISAPRPVAPPVAPQNSNGGNRRPVRGGMLWPGESFGSRTRKWDLTGAFTNSAFRLAGLGAGTGSRSV